MKRTLVKRMVTTALMMAVQILLSRFLFISTLTLKVSLDFLPMAVLAMLYGPVWTGFAWGFCDVIGALLFPIGPYYFGFTLSAAVFGALFGIFLFPCDNRPVRAAMAAVVPSAVVTLGLDTFWLHRLYGTPVPAVLGSRLIKCAVMIPAMILLILLTGRIFSDYIRKNNASTLKKQQLRRVARRYFDGGFSGGREAISAKICENAVSTAAYRDADTIFCYVGRPNEIDTEPILMRAWSDGKTVTVPRCESPRVMTARKITGMEQLSPGRFGIREPSAALPEIPPEQIGLIFVPALMCDRKGGRLGYGGGYYDRFLKGRGAPVKMALCAEAMISGKVPQAPGDVRMDFAATEKTVYKM